MKPLTKFADWNKKEALAHLIASERHLNSLPEGGDSDFAACVNKHLVYVARSELGELASHEPEKRILWQRLARETEGVIEGLANKTITIPEAVDTIRSVREGIEKETEGFNVSKCKACGDITGFSDASDEKGLYAKTPHYTSEPTMRKADTKLLTKIVAPVYAGELVGEAGTMGVDYLASLYPSTPLGQYLGATIDAVVAIALTYAVMITKSEAWQLIEAAIGGYFVADGVQKLSQPYVPVAARTFYMAPTGAGQVMVTASPAIGKYTY